MKNNDYTTVFRKEESTDRIYWVDYIGEHPPIGEYEFSFDKKKIYNLFRDYPWAMTPEEVEIFDKENPYWADFFADRKEKAKSKRDYSNVHGGEAQRVFDEAKQLGIDTKGIDNLDVIKAKIQEKKRLQSNSEIGK